MPNTSIQNLNQKSLSWLQSQLGEFKQITPLTHNHTNQCFIAYPKHHPAVFIKQLNSKILSTNSFKNERTSRHWAQQITPKITPNTLYENAQLGLIIDELVSSRNTSPTISDLVSLMSQLHQQNLPINSNIIRQQIFNDIQNLLAALKLPEYSFKSLLTQAKQLDESQQACCICHGDLSFENILIGEQPYLIDWEYARVAEPAYDLAASILINNLNSNLQQQLITKYCQHNPQPEQNILNRVQQYLKVLKPLNQLWFTHQHQLQ
ncbi:phosphotransferase family protein [Catenovulum adriaticum]|uniref:Phosphotransferase n=1 Tax=Catenovulum adriaticum TaxID=2984846 RepID=A0ABY7AIT7_9ALTE|nr:phosphotransferase [Catenovulum sp. TS8]WAJ69354.1 phosphotransferase [Catenovulum sp. TS8]